MKKLILFALIFCFLLANFNLALAQGKKAEVNFFYSSTCPHCAAEEKFLETLKQKYPGIEIKSYEVVHNPENKKVLEDFYQKYNVPDNEKGYVPVTFTPTKYFVGFNDQTGKDIETCLMECLGMNGGSSKTIKVPFLGEVDASKVSLPVLTVVLGTLDGFNPCAMWVLVMLISLLLASKSRKKIALIGGIFIFAEGLLYFLFMTAWLNAFLFIQYVTITRMLIGVFGIGFGVLRIKDFFTWKPATCKVVGDSGKEKLFNKINKVLMPKALPATILGVIALAFGVNMIEFFCSAGFPVVFTRVLTLQNIGTLQYYLYMFFYNIFYMLDDFIVFGFAFFTLRHFDFSDKYNKYSTLIAGVLMLILGILLIFKPNFLTFG
ncbi:MAG: hypothetical protein NTU58_01960 [Candidatus Nealsonbacteria bacterium]|nr:hypothetical protein [Candidatus Nealsonbacteria bacterium]